MGSPDQLALIHRCCARLGVTLGFHRYGPYSNYMKIWGALFVIFGAFWTIAGFVSYKSDIQLVVALAGINMFGIGYIMFHLAKRESENPDSSRNAE
jgi:hypothetical protein